MPVLLLIWKLYEGCVDGCAHVIAAVKGAARQATGNSSCCSEAHTAAELFCTCSITPWKHEIVPHNV